MGTVWIGPTLLSLVVAQAHAQSQSQSHETAAWIGLMTDTQLRGPVSLTVDSHYNSRAFIVLRGGLTYNTSAGPSFTGGFAHLWTNPGNGGFSRNEHRPWAQIFLPFNFSDDWTVSQRFRGELRVQQNVENGETVPGYSMTPRFRAQTAATYWFAHWKKMDFLAQAMLEMFMNAGPNAGPNYLDQSRWGLMLGYRKSETTVRVGYVNRFIPGKSGASPLHEHDVIFWFSFSFRDQKTRAADLPEGQNP